VLLCSLGCSSVILVLRRVRGSREDLVSGEFNHKHPSCGINHAVSHGKYKQNVE
jgi:hypothetical protein